MDREQEARAALEIKYLKKINGKEVTYIEGGVEIPAILIWPPGGEQVSVKPFGIKADELADRFMVAFGAPPEERGRILSEVGDPSFCLSEFPVGIVDYDVTDTLKKLAVIGDNGKFIYHEITHVDGMGLPTCPY
jgi:hypothetical protein